MTTKRNYSSSVTRMLVQAKILGHDPYCDGPWNRCEATPNVVVQCRRCGRWLCARCLEKGDSFGAETRRCEGAEGSR